MSFSLVAASGLPYVLGTLLIGLVSGVATPKSTAALIAFRVLAVVSAAFIAVSGAPTPSWLLLPGAAALVAWSVVPPRAPAYEPLRNVLRMLLPVMALIAVVFELPYLVLPTQFPCEDPICVLGDSLSAGAGDGADVWPSVLARKLDVSVRNFARADAKLADGAAQAARLPKSASTVLVLLGGNDLASGRSAAEFEQDLDALLSPCAAAGHHVLMFELPLMPGAGEYGRVQRSVAARHGATLIPKRALALLLARPGMTRDGLHLSPRGHLALAELVSGLLDHGGARNASN